MVGSATPATKVLTTADVAHRVHSYRHERRTTAYGDAAVDALAATIGVVPAQIFKTLVLQLSGGAWPGPALAVAVLPVPTTLSPKSAATALGASKATLADPSDAQRRTGYVVGGISPLGQRTPLPTVIDSSATTWDRVLCSAGRRGLEIELAPDDLIRLTAATVADIIVR
ncbi:aminoacyl-tRNA deacylase [Skermania piniformis]|uniref:Cys-tRNA(Pro)/Cys-tRNA(Cys) deacylase n=1 Tax=Skermania pinensis TaxID=39122 RepID=A0ABX8SA46_9ACTN|nr:aminoacyl-tRNA deacylase [Skermania piniformis]QXQ14692.1 aminoacyl-tRNA deacylase [Skermania piniformis]